MENPFPPFVFDLPQKDYGFDGLTVHADHSAIGETYFVFAEKELHFPENAHGAQWTVVISGKCDFTADGKTTSYKKGDTYYILTGLKHQITLYPGYAEVDYTLKTDSDGRVPRKIDRDL